MTEAEGAPQLTSTDSLGEVKEEEDSHCPFLLLDLSLTILLLLTLLLTLTLVLTLTLAPALTLTLT